MRAYNRDMVEVEVLATYVLLPRFEVRCAVKDAMEFGLGVLDYLGANGSFLLAIRKLPDDDKHRYEVTLLDKRKKTVTTEISSEESIELTRQVLEAGQ